MNDDILQGQWTRMKGQVKEQWGKFTDDDVERINGRQDQLVGMIQQRYGEAKEDAARQVREFIERHTDPVLNKASK